MPTYGRRRDARYIGSMTSTINEAMALQTAMYLLKAAYCSLKTTRRLAICGPVASAGKIGAVPGLGGGMNRAAERVL